MTINSGKAGDKSLSMKYSIIFIVDRGSDEFWAFFDLIRSLFRKTGDTFEIIIIANGSESIIVPKIYSDEYHLDNLTLFVFQRSVPHSVCIKAAFSACNGRFILSLSAFQELTSESYEKLIHSMSDDVDMVVACRMKRKDALLNRLHSTVLNMAIRYVMNIKLRDNGCNVRVFRREVLESVVLYGNLYNYFPGLAAQKGFKIREVECNQAIKERKVQFYAWKLYLIRSVEILNLFFSTRFSKKPLRFFNLFGSIFFLIGIISLLYIGFEGAFFDVPIGDRKSLIIGIICLIGGVQIASFGLLGEIISFVYGRFRKDYSIEKTI